MTALDPDDGGSYPGRDVARPLVELSRAVGELEAVDVVLRDIDRGLVDFPALRDGEEVYLCWLVDEQTRSASGTSPAPGSPAGGRSSAEARLRLGRPAAPPRAWPRVARQASGRVGVGLVERLVLEQGRDQRVEVLAVREQQVGHLVVCGLDDPPDLLVDHPLRAPPRSR